MLLFDADVLITPSASNIFLNDINLWGDVGISSNNTTRLIEVCSLHQKFGKSICNTLPALQPLIGFDYIIPAERYDKATQALRKEYRNTKNNE